MHKKAGGLAAAGWCYVLPLKAYCLITLNSTRRFSARPSSLLLLDTGTDSPKQHDGRKHLLSKVQSEKQC